MSSAPLIAAGLQTGCKGALDKLAAMGFNPSDFVGAITSGEVTHAKLSDRTDPFWAGLGTRCLHLTWGARGAISLQGLGLQVPSGCGAKVGLAF